MRIGVVADIHSNSDAFNAVLKELSDIEQIWCLGDIVGYGPEPVECLRMLRERNHICVIGNHDLCALDGIDSAEFNEAARESCYFTRQSIRDDEIEYMFNLALTHEPMPGILLVHGSPHGSTWDYVVSSWQAEEILTTVEASLIIVGHSHVPLLFKQQPHRMVEFIHLIEGQTYALDMNMAKYLINPGSVGQPRDGDSRASYMTLDTDEWTLSYHRVEYPIKTTQQKMQQANLPELLWHRLETGL